MLETCARRLRAHGVATTPGRHPGEVGLEWHEGKGELGTGEPGPEVAISWHGPAGFPATQPASEATIQGLCGLMHLHGRDWGGPRRLGLEVASVAAGLLTAQGWLAARIGARRGQPGARLETSVLEAGMLLVSHYVAAATCREPWEPAPAGPDPGPPFSTVDGRWFEIETLDPEGWKRFWHGLGAREADLGRAWALFRSRYYRGTCPLPRGLHQATAAHPLATIVALAGECGVSLSPLRDYQEVLADPGQSAHLPSIELDSSLAAPQPPPDPARSVPVVPADQVLPLRGLRVIEATSRLQGPLAGLLLQMLGADVVRVEPPGGDFGRIVPPVAGDTGSFFLCFNRGKEPVQLDLSRPSGREELVELVAGADVFLHNWRPGKAEEWGLDADDLLAVNPRLVHATASGWGDRPIPLLGTDYLVQAYAGLGEGLHPAGTPPFPSRVILVDYFGALITTEGILGGLYQREVTGRGARVGASLLAGAMALQAHVLDALVAGAENQRSAGRPLWGKLDQPVATADGLLVVSVNDDLSFQHLCQTCDVDAPGSSRVEVEDTLRRCLAGRSSEYWQQQLTEAGLAAAAVPAHLDLASLPTDPRLRRLFEPLAETCQAPRSPWHVSA